MANSWLMNNKFATSASIRLALETWKIRFRFQAGGGSETVDTSEEEQNSWSASDQEVPHLGAFLDGMFDDFLHLLMVFYMDIYILTCFYDS